MRKISGPFLLGLLVCYTCATHGRSLLTAQSFPKTTDDLTFSQRVALLEDSYADWDSEYDENGRCVRNCPYVGMTVEEEIEYHERAAEIMCAELKSRGYSCGNEPVSVAPVTTPQPAVQAPTTTATTNVASPAVSSTTAGVTNKPTVSHAASTTTSAGLTKNFFTHNPIDPIMLVSSPYGPRELKTSPNHGGIDFSAKIGDRIYATAPGTATCRNEPNGCGKYVNIDHGNNIRTLYCHLSEYKIPCNGPVQVQAGQLIGAAGSTGHSTGPHLHYQINHGQAGKINPAPYLNAGAWKCKPAVAGKANCSNYAHLQAK